jgi:hypothetical protein
LGSFENISFTWSSMGPLGFDSRFCYWRRLLAHQLMRGNSAFSSTVLFETYLKPGLQGVLVLVGGVAGALAAARGRLQLSTRLALGRRGLVAFGHGERCGLVAVVWKCLSAVDKDEVKNESVSITASEPSI